jgi:hypothetical protein
LPDSLKHRKTANPGIEKQKRGIFVDEWHIRLLSAGHVYSNPSSLEQGEQNSYIIQ